MNEGEQKKRKLDDIFNKLTTPSDNKRQNSRYYNSFVSIRCFKCGETGHSLSECPEENVQFCFICLKNHDTFFCAKHICRRCGDIGHNFKSCNNHQAVKTRHVFDFISPKLVRKVEDLSSVMCLFCREYGHINCKNFSKIPKKKSKRSNSENKRKMLLNTCDDTVGKDSLIYILPWELEGEKCNNPEIRSSKHKLDAVKTYCFNCGSKNHSTYVCKRPKVSQIVQNFGDPLDYCFICKESVHNTSLCPKNQKHVKNFRKNNSFKGRW